MPDEGVVDVTTLYGPEFFVGRTEHVRLSASVVVPHLMELLAPTSVLDVGCGQGEWLAQFTVPDWQKDLHGVDIAAPFRLGFTHHDLTQPLELNRYFDLVLCLETGEHLPEEASDTLVDTLVRHAGDIVFSAAVPGQEGAGHINCQPHEYWHAKFAARGFEMYDVIRPRIKDNPNVSPWYRDNMFLYLDAAA